MPGPLRSLWWHGTIILGAVAMVAALGAQAAGQAPARPRPSPFQPPEPLDYGDHTGWTSLFDGQTLTGWDGNPAVWRVSDGAITATSTAERRVGSTHLIWQGGELSDFELKFEIKLDGDIHAGVAYRSFVDTTRGARAQAAGRGATPGAGRGATPTAGRGATPATSQGATPGTGRGPAGPAIPSDPRWTLYGPGLDYDADLQMAGNVEDRGTPRREVAWRGGIVRDEAGQRPRLIGTLGDSDALLHAIKPNDWNQVHIIVSGHQFTHIINGQVMTILIDEDPEYYRPSGLIGLQIEMYGLGQVNVRNVWLKRTT